MLSILVITVSPLTEIIDVANWVHCWHFQCWRDHIKNNFKNNFIFLKFHVSIFQNFFKNLIKKISKKFLLKKNIKIWFNLKKNIYFSLV